MGKKKKSDEHAFGPQLLKHPAVKRALADVAVAAVLAIAAKFGGSKLVKEATQKAAEDLAGPAKPAVRPARKPVKPSAKKKAKARKS